MTVPNYYSTLPQERGFAMYVVATQLVASRYLDIYRQDCDNASPANAHGYAADSGNIDSVFFAIPGARNNAAVEFARHQIQEYRNNNPDFASDAWCGAVSSPTTPYPYAGQYLPVNWRAHRILSTEAFSCPHCAYKKAVEFLTARNLSAARASVLVWSPLTEIDDTWQSFATPEVIGETLVETSATIRDYDVEHGLACNKCGRLGHGTRVCENPPKHFHKLGIEIEGRFMDLLACERKAEDLGMTFSGDGSIAKSPDTDAEACEFKTKPGNLREAIEQLVALYPDETDKTCGMHVHMSFQSPCHISMLSTYAFFNYFKKRWKEWGEKMALHPQSQFYKRLNGENAYCNENEVGLRDITSCDRYSQLNFSAWQAHGTLECRTLPMFRRSSLGVAAVQELVAIYEDFLSAPEQYGMTWEELTPVALDKAMLNSVPVREKQELEMPAKRSHTQTTALELEELAQPAAGMVRIALPVNMPITVEVLAARLRHVTSERAAA